MKLALLLSILPLSSTAFYLPSSPTTIIASSITDSITTTSSRFSSSSSRLHYKTSHEYEYGNSDDRVVQRALLSTSEDRWNVLNVLENDVLLNHVGERPRIVSIVFLTVCTPMSISIHLNSHSHVLLFSNCSQNVNSTNREHLHLPHQ